MVPIVFACFTLRTGSKARSTFPLSTTFVSTHCSLNYKRYLFHVYSVDCMRNHCCRFQELNCTCQCIWVSFHIFFTILYYEFILRLFLFDRFAVTTVFISTTVLLTLQIRFIRRNNIFITMAFFFFFGFIDCLFWGASLKKVPSGAWVPLMIGTLL